MFEWLDGMKPMNLQNEICAFGISVSACACVCVANSWAICNSARGFAIGLECCSLGLRRREIQV